MVLSSLLNEYVPAVCRDIFGMIGQLGSAGISAGSDIAATALTNKANAENVAATNQANIDIANANNQLQREMNAENNAFAANQAAAARQHDLDMANLQHRLNSPLELAKQYGEAGFNPAVMMSGQSAMATGVSNSGAMASPHGSGITPSMPVLTPFMNEKMPNIASGISETILKLAQAKKVGADTRTIDQTRDLMSRLLKGQAEQVELANNIQSVYGMDLASVTVAKLKQECATSGQLSYTYATQGDLNKSLKVAADMKARLDDIASQAKGEERDLLRKQNETFYQTWQSQLRESAARANQANSQAELFKKEGVTEDQLRAGRKLLLEKDAQYRTQEIVTSRALRNKIAEETIGIIEQVRHERFTNDQRDRMVDELDKIILYDAEQSRQNYHNPFNYFGKLLQGL